MLKTKINCLILSIALVTLLFAPIWSQILKNSKRVHYSIWNTIQTDIAEHQFLLPGIN